MPVLSLFELARQRLIKNIDLLNDVGDIPFAFLEHILRHIQNPDQLQELEANCPQVQGETGEIWLRLIKRDIPDWHKKPHKPRDPRNWHKVYRKLKKDAEVEKDEQQNALKEQMRALQKDRAQNKTTIVDSNIGYGARSSRVFGLGSSSGWGGSGAPAKTGKEAMDKLKRGMFDYKRERPRAAQMPTHLLAQRKTQVRAAPARMVRMAENEGPKNMVISRQAAASVAQRSEPLPEMKRPHITHRPVPQQNAAAPPRPSLPAGQQFSAPKLKPAEHDPAAQALKKRKDSSSMFHKPKRRKI
ncbi:RNA polymerase II transcription factor SIII subunit A-domain-containing protein [Ampelomyces quisqualis]|uniref:RNA polymerase II transcription factor SIII subunit A-domain-containing protein n=1 Tax=Ampelomyces quisqualis TaxID=50730 RepID=A0A6A5QM21_AMPQU|nr:RNA polymerase II transcription factor SIII subunit A-domain-containing protein [Ampelomyces quisqualis]